MDTALNPSSRTKFQRENCRGCVLSFFPLIFLSLSVQCVPPALRFVLQRALPKTMHLEMMIKKNL